MRKRVLFICTILLAAMVNAQEFVTYKEAKDPVKVSERSKVAWKEAKKMEAQWVSADSLYSRSEVPAKSGVTVRVLEGWKGERVSAQLLLWSGKGVDGIKCKVKDFVSTDAKMPADIAKARFVRYTIADQGGYDCRCDRGPKHKAFLAPDMIDTLNVFNMEPHSVRPVWVTVDIPSDAKPGRYSSAIVVTAKGVGKTILPLEVEVIDQTLPEYTQWSYHLDLWQHPSAVARALNLEMWSDEHFEALKQQMKLLAEAGQKVITTTLNRDPWGSQTFDDYEDMIIWTKDKKGNWSFDYTVFDRYVEMMMELGIKKQINCYSMLPWNNRLNWYENNELFKVSSINPKSERYEEMWSVFLQDFVKHLKEKGWLEITNIATDERSPEEMEIVVNLIKKYAPELGFAMADNKASFRRIPNVRDCCVAQRQGYLTHEEINERRAKGYVTTFYVCCSTYFPNSFTYSQPWESELLSWHAISKDYDGQLRWAYNSWPARPEYDSRFRTMASGDTYQVYPYARTSMRFERLRDGIEAYEKIKILRKKYSDRSDVLAPLEKKLEKMATMRLTDTNLPWHAMMEEVAGMLNSISRKLAE
ncbi:MAG: DUF4091 domain-containing protein [Bacteroidaceae bacterium]|nr:DUF4091 domain-containing protein [Bacteroidaceae bacterium]